MTTSTQSTQRPSSSATTTVVPSLLEIHDHAQLIDHHAARVSSNHSATNATNATSSTATLSTSRAVAASIWTAPAPAHGVRGGDVSSDWINPASWPEQRGTPSYRPIDFQINRSRRPWANTVPEIIFVFTMIGFGVQTLGFANTIFRKTVGKIEAVNKYFRYQSAHEL